MLTVTTLKKRAEFVRLNRGRKFMTAYFILRHAPSELQETRVGYTVTTKCGNAVVRNRIRRRLRALDNELAPEHAVPATDYVFIVRNDAIPNAADVAYPLLREAVRRALAAGKC